MRIGQRETYEDRAPGQTRPSRHADNIKNANNILLVLLARGTGLHRICRCIQYIHEYDNLCEYTIYVNRHTIYVKSAA